MQNIMEFAILVEREPAIEGSYGCSIPVYFFILKKNLKKFKIIFFYFKLIFFNIFRLFWCVDFKKKFKKIKKIILIYF